MDMKCPGVTGIRAPVPAIKECSKCGKEVEMWSDEFKVHCTCGEIIFRENLPSCIEWCRAAEKCLGKERFEEYMSRLKEAKQNDRR